MLTGAVQDPHNEDAVIDWLIEDEVVAHDESAQAVPQVILGFSKLRIAGQEIEGASETINHPIGGGRVVDGNVQPDVANIFIRKRGELMACH